MRGCVAWLSGLLILAAPVSARAQAWSGIIAPSRATTWSSAGVEGGIPPRPTICATLNPGATAAQINSAIASCPTNQTVMLNAGTYTLSGGIVIDRNNVTLRGRGADVTKLIINGATSGCSLFYNSAFRMCAGGGNIGSVAGGAPGPDNSATWTSGYAKGSTIITLSNTTNLTVGSTIYLDQNNDNADGWPAAGDLYVCDGSVPCSWEGGNSWARVGRVQTELHKVVSISGSNVQIDPPVHAPNFRSSQSPGAWWGNASSVLQNSGVEDLTIDFTGAGSVGVALINATNCWVKGLRLIRTGGPGSFVFHVLVVNGFRVTTRDNYFYGPNVVGNTQYAYTPHVSGSLLLENNIIHHSTDPAAPNDPEAGSVYAYNYVDDAFYPAPGFQSHSSGDFMNLYEGNNMGTFFSDAIHGTHFFNTIFRNHIDKFAHNSGCAEACAGIVLNSHSRFFNLIGNVLGGYLVYQAITADNDTAAFQLGFAGSHGGIPPLANDPDVARTVMRWGNWDNVNNANRFVASEVPSGIPNFPNPVPASQTLPASLYLPGKPAYFTFAGSAWPPIGPDITGGDIAGYGGHANRVPARLCFERATDDPAYPSSSPRVKMFNAANCYGSGSGTGTPPPGAPTNVRIIR